jgi:hypothetical protein
MRFTDLGLKINIPVGSIRNLFPEGTSSIRRCHSRISKPEEITYKPISSFWEDNFKAGCQGNRN